MYVACFDLTNFSTLTEVETEHNGLIEKFASYDNIPRILVGLKYDLSKFREVEESDGKEMAEKLGMDYIEVSANTGHNLE